MRLATVSFLCFIPLLVGCAAMTPPVGGDAIRPPKLRPPVFVVVPANRSFAEDSFATEIERHLLANKMRVAVRPTFKAVRIEMGGSESQSAAVATNAAVGGRGAAVTEGEDRVIESFLEMTDTTANYRINTYSHSNTVELVDLSNQQVLAVVSRPSNLGAGLGLTPNLVSLLLGTLREIGFEVSQPPAQAASGRHALVAIASQLSPILTVIPSSDLLWQTSYAVDVEHLLVGLGLHVVRPPAPRYKEQSAALTKAAASNVLGDSSTKTASARKVESFWVHEDTAANVILETTTYGGRSVKIIDKASKEVRAVASVYSIQDMRDALIAAGIPVAEPLKRSPVKRRKAVKAQKKS